MAGIVLDKNCLDSITEKGWHDTQNKDPSRLLANQEGSKAKNEDQLPHIYSLTLGLSRQ